MHFKDKSSYKIFGSKNRFYTLLQYNANVTWFISSFP